ncbi:MAG: DNA polymerase III subunit chi [Gammaproteobacteria bacterium]|jgi:DNA polymerase-3 subunit chi
MSSKQKPRIDFYKLNSQDRTSIIRFCCQLADKVVKMGNPVFVKTKDPTESRVMDDLMWAYSDSSFLPHAILDDAADGDVPVTIGHNAYQYRAYLLINLSEELPDNIQNFERIAEVINEAPQTLQLGRKRYAAYKQGDYALHYHEITS